MSEEKEAMLTKSGNHRVEVRENARGGKGQLALHHLFENEQLAPNSRLLCKIVVQPGNSMGMHTHQGESEFFYVLSGSAKFTENGEILLLNPGDTLYTPPGGNHSFEVNGDETLELLAVVINK